MVRELLVAEVRCVAQLTKRGNLQQLRTVMIFVVYLTMLSLAQNTATVWNARAFHELQIGKHIGGRVHGQIEVSFKYILKELRYTMN
jgi:hypothetical protein